MALWYKEMTFHQSDDQDENPGENEPANSDVTGKDGTNAIVSKIAQILPTLDGFDNNQNTSIHTGDSIQSNTPAREKLLADASIARKKHHKSIDEESVLQYLRSLTGKILIENHIEDPQVTIYGFTDSVLDQIIKRFTEDPLPRKSDENVFQVMDSIETLTSPIGHADAIRFKKWSDSFVDKRVPLSKIVDAKTQFIINTEFKRNQVKLNLTEDDVKHWYTKWTHNKLAEVVSK
jgi:hypothetical protein